MPRPISSVLSLPFWQDRKEGHHAQTKPRMKIQGILSKHEVIASATKIYRLAHTINPPLDGGPAALHTAGGFSRVTGHAAKRSGESPGGAFEVNFPTVGRDEPLESLFAFFLSIQKEGPRRRGGRRGDLKIAGKGGKGPRPKPKPKACPFKKRPPTVPVNGLF